MTRAKQPFKRRGMRPPGTQRNDVDIRATVVGSKHTGQSGLEGRHDEERTSGSELDTVSVRARGENPRTTPRLLTGRDSSGGQGGAWIMDLEDPM
ncbi:hypothetical protein R1flu_017260 [Riccia fluitans]|uniref:Uncharacterized protein n=1 Tax=Riccia fluitans TaxID=41844 RepID=A0ABD1XEK7_9MARC